MTQEEQVGTPNLDKVRGMFNLARLQAFMAADA